MKTRLWVYLLAAIGLVVLVGASACGTERTVASASGTFAGHDRSMRQEVVLKHGDVRVTYNVKPVSGAGSWQATLTPVSGAATNGPAYRWVFSGSEAKQDQRSVSLPGGRYELSLVGRGVDYSITLAQTD